MAMPPKCVICKQPESRERLGNYYNAVSASGMRLQHFWVCNPCAIPLGPKQGASAEYFHDLAEPR